MRIIKDHNMNSIAREDKMVRSILINILCICFVLMMPLMAEAATTPGPTISILTPATGTTASKPTVMVLIQVWDSDGTATITKYQLDSTIYTDVSPVVLDSNRSCGTNCSIYKYLWDLSSYTDNTSHRIRFAASDGSTETASRLITVTVKAAKTGNGMLLARDSSSQLCLDCHNILGHSSMTSHGSQTTPSVFGNWETICLDCHTPHNTRNIDLVKDNIFWSFYSATIGTRAVKLYTKAGDTANSFVNSSLTGTNVNGVCQVCHRKTRNPSTLVSRWITTGNPEGDHYQGTSERCSSCHLHTEGFRGRDCGQCHKTPPDTGNHPVHGASANYIYGSLVIDSTTTQYGFDCGICHSGTHQNTPSNPHTVEVKFAGVASQDLKSGTPLYTPSTNSIYTGFGGYTFNYSDGTCSNTYCHGNYPGSGKNISIKHNTGSTGSCGTSANTCHNASNSDSAYPITGSHQRHVTSSAILSGETENWHTYNRGYSCTLCHGDLSGVGTPSSSGAYSSYTIYDKSKHVNGVVDWQFTTADPRVLDAFYSKASGTYAPSDGVTRAYGYCTVYCHSNVQGNLGYGTPSSYSKMTWSTDRNRCSGCHVPVTSQGTGTNQHGRDMSTGSHTRHYAQLDRANCNNPTPCLICHQWNSTASVNDLNDPTCDSNCNQCHDAKISATNELTKHVNGIINIAFDTFYGDVGVYNGTGTPGDGYGNCSNTYCHSNGTSVSTGTIMANDTLSWGIPDSVYRQCYDCHSNTKYLNTDYRKASPMYASGSPKANAHQLHLREGGSTVVDPSCANCHYDTTTDNISIASKLKHMNKEYNVSVGSTYPAWAGTYAGTTETVSIGSFTFTPNPGPSTCTNVSCHADGLGTKTAMWSEGYYCTECHKVDMNNTAGYHHVMNSSALTSRVYPLTVPTSTVNDANRKCIMCHVDHIIFNPMLNDSSGGRAFNLRTSILDTPGDLNYYTNKDFDNNLTYGGICTSCHRNALDKNTTNQKNDSTTRTQVVTRAIYTPSSHNYSKISTFKSEGSGNFNANCSKCHNNTNDPKTFQNTTPQLATHDNSLRSLLSPLGITTPTDPIEQEFCFRCHSTASNIIGGTKKSATVNDWYGAVTNMTARSTDTFASFYSTPDGTPATKSKGHMLWNYTGLHKPSSTDETQSYISSNKHVECGDCHNVHAAATPLHTQGVSTGNNVSKLLTSVPAVTANYAVAATSTLWFRETTPYEAVPAANENPLLITFQGSAVQGIREMLPVQGSSVETQTITINQFGNPLYWRATSFISPPVANITNISAGNWVFRIWGYENLPNANAYIHLAVYVWTWADKKGANIVSATTNGTELPPTTSSANAMTVAGSAVTLNPGDRIVVELMLETRNATQPYTATYSWNGAGSTDDSKVTLPTAVSFITYTAASAATKEYEICFKCHSGANTNYSSWGGTYNASPLAWTDVGMEFDPNNKSGHPVVTGLNNYTNSPTPKALATAQLTSPWNVNVGTQTMYCSDCHSTDSTVSSGPHASATRWMLAGTNKAWPYTLASNNGTSSGTYRTLVSRATGNGTVDGLFCLNCHPLSLATNSAHNEGGHLSGGGGTPVGPYACVICHIRVPHGGKISRLIAADNTGTGLPARYYPDGNGGGRLSTVLRKYTKANTPGNYQTSSCYVGCYADHNNSGNGTETW